MRGITQPWSEIELRYVMDNYKTMTKPKIVEGLKQFGSGHTIASVKALYTRYGLVSGIDGRFKKGHDNGRKGKKLSPEAYERIKKTCFKKGNRPHNTVEVGTEIVTSIWGYVKVKIAEPNVWEFKHRLVWEKANGPVPKGYRITFLDGNRTNCELSNLCLITSGENAILNRDYKDFDSPEQRQIQVDIVRIKRLCSKAEKEKK